MTTRRPSTAVTDPESVAAASDTPDAGVAGDTPDAVVAGDTPDTGVAGNLPDAVAASDTPDAGLAAESPKPKPRKPITWESERNTAAEALVRAGAEPREVRVLASLGAIASIELRAQARDGVGDAATVDDRAAAQVLAAHRAAANPEWRQ